MRPCRLAIMLGTMLASACGAAGEGLAEPAACARPAVTHDTLSPNPGNVLGASIRVRVANADSLVVRYGTGASLDSVTPAALRPEGSGDVEALVLGLLPLTSYRAEAVAFNACGSTTGRALAFTTGALPADLPRFTASGASPSPGYVVFGAGSYGVVIDNSGRVVWYHRFASGTGLNFQPQPNGRYAARPPATAGGVASWVEINPANDTTRALGCARGLPVRMHDMIALPDGSYWIMCDETRTMDLTAQGAAAATMVSGTTVQRRSASGALVFEWNAFDHLDVVLADIDSADRVGSVVNWSHGNAIDIDSAGNLLVSLRNLSEVTNVDTRTGNVLWRMGGARNTITLENGDTPPFARQHGVRAFGGGIVLLDNLGERSGSRVERYEIDNVRRVARLSATYTSTARVIAQLGGNTQSFHSGRTLVSFGSGGAVEEYDVAGNLAWRLDGNPGYIFRAQRIRSLYHPGLNDPR